MNITLESSFNVEDVLTLTQFPYSDKEPKIEELLSKLRKLQQAKLDLEEDINEAHSLRNTLHNEEDALSIRILKLKETLNEKDDTCRSLQLKCEDFEQESQRQFELKQQNEELVGQYSCQIQETKLRHRKIRMKFENQLQQLMGQHKNLYTVFTPERLPTEIQSAEYATQQLLKAEQQVLEQATHLQEELNIAQATDSVKRMHDESYA